MVLYVYVMMRMMFMDVHLFTTEKGVGVSISIKVSGFYARYLRTVVLVKRICFSASSYLQKLHD